MSEPIVVVVTLKDTQGFEKIWIDGVCAASGKDLLIKDDVSGDFETSNVKVECFDAALYAQTKESCIPLTIKFLSGDEWREIDMNGDSNKFMQEEMDSAWTSSKTSACTAQELDQIPTPGNKITYIHVTTNVDVNDLDEDDMNVAGIYRVALSESTPDEGLANAALDGLHYNVPIGVLENFSITVRKSEEPSSEEIASSDEFENGELRKQLVFIDFIARDEVDGSKPSAEIPR